jgi:pimeloyl-ACP methyl ester carboxylesterase
MKFTRVMSSISIAEFSTSQGTIFWLRCKADEGAAHAKVIELFAQARFQTSIRAFDVLTPPNPDYMQLINTLDNPSLLVVGDVGSVVTLEMAAELAELNQRIRVVEIQEAGHGIPYDQPERFLAVVQTFLHSVR